MSNVQPFFSEKTLNTQRSTVNAQQFSAFTVGRWTLDVGRCRAIAGGVAERLIAPVLKTGRPKGLVSSNLTPSAILDYHALTTTRACRIKLLHKHSTWTSGPETTIRKR